MNFLGLSSSTETYSLVTCLTSRIFNFIIKSSYSINFISPILSRNHHPKICYQTTFTHFYINFISITNSKAFFRSNRTLLFCLCQKRSRTLRFELKLCRRTQLVRRPVADSSRNSQQQSSALWSSKTRVKISNAKLWNAKKSPNL